MWTYILRRLLLMIVTIFGITLVTLGIMRLTPGDPAQMAIKQAEQGGDQVHLSRDDLEQIRARWGLDKPAFFNTQPSDRTVRYNKRLLDYEDTERVVKEIPRKLTLLGAAGLEPAFERLALDLEEQKAWKTHKKRPERPAAEDRSGGSSEKDDKPPEWHALKTLKHLAGDLAVKPDKELDAAGWQAWWAKHSANLTPQAGEEAAKAYLAKKDPAASIALRAKVGTLANPALIARLDDADPAVQLAVCTALSEINRKPSWRPAPKKAKDLEELARVRKLWRQFWREEESKFIDLTAGQRWSRLVTETHYATWLGQLFRWDFGDSTKEHKPVLEVLYPRIKVTLQLALLSILLAYLIAIPLGIYSATRSYTISDRLTTLMLFILYSLPSFWVGNLMILFFTGGKPQGPGSILGWSMLGLFGFLFTVLAVLGAERLASRAAQGGALVVGLGGGMLLMGYASLQLDFFPYASTRIGEPLGIGDWMAQMTLPILCYTYASFAYLSRQMRASMMETIRADFIRTARAKGLPEQMVVLKHALRNSLIPILTIMANVLPMLIGGSVIIEQIFEIQGMGKLAFTAVFDRDYPVLMAIAFFSSVLTLFGILLSDISYALVDPRITYS